MTKRKVNELFFMQPWAIQEDMLRVMSGIFERYLKGEKLSIEEIEAKTGAEKKEKPAYEIINGVAHIPIYGVISKRSSLIKNISCSAGSSVQEIEAQFKEALKDKKVETILLDIDSPGGSVGGVAELSDLIHSSRGNKPIYAYANGQMASAAYWIGSAADKIFASKSSAIGSIGVYLVVNDMTVAYHNAGIKTEVIKAGRNKAAGHPQKHFSAEDRQVLQEEIDSYFEMFVEAVQRNRGMSADEVEKVATGQVYIGKKAHKIGLVDDMKTFDDFISGFEGSGSSQQDLTPMVGVEALDNAKKSEAASSPAEIKNHKKNEEELMDFSKLTVESLKTERPDLAESLRKEGVESVKEDPTKETQIEEKAKQGERDRAVGILDLISIEGEPYKGMDDIAKEAIKSGETVVQAEDKMKDQKIKDLQSASPPNAGFGEGEEGSSDTEALTLDEQVDKDWEKDAKVREEFSSKENYKGYLRAKNAGRIKILRKE